MTEIVIPTEDGWQAVSEVLAPAAKSGAIILAPDMRRLLHKRFRVSEAEIEDLDGEVVDYDFGGAPDYIADVVSDEKHLAWRVICKALDLPDINNGSHI